MSEPGNAENGLPENRPCYRCGKNPAEGFASVWTAATGERWYCHGDDDESPTCYESAPQMPDAAEVGICLWANQICEQPNHHGCKTCLAVEPTRPIPPAEGSTDE